jgi:hypothetical protein
MIVRYASRTTVDICYVPISVSLQPNVRPRHLSIWLPTRFCPPDPILPPDPFLPSPFCLRPQTRHWYIKRGVPQQVPKAPESLRSLKITNDPEEGYGLARRARLSASIARACACTSGECGSDLSAARK